MFQVRIIFYGGGGKYFYPVYIVLAACHCHPPTVPSRIKTRYCYSGDLYTELEPLNFFATKQSCVGSYTRTHISFGPD